MKKNQHVVAVNGEWGVRGEGNSRLTSIHQTHGEAIEAAREIAINQRSEVVIHRLTERFGTVIVTGTILFLHGIASTDCLKDLKFCAKQKLRQSSAQSKTEQRLLQSVLGS